MGENEMHTRSVERAMDILECFLEEDELSLNEIAKKTSLSSATVLRIINSLQKRGYVSRDLDTKRYSLGGTFQSFIHRVDSKNEGIKKAAKPIMEELYQAYNENVRLFVLDGKFLLCMELYESTQDVRQVIHIGDRRRLNLSATGRLFLAHMSPKQRDQLAPDLELDASSLDEIRSDGYALSTDSNESGIIAISAPIFNRSGKMVAALSLSGPAFRLINRDMTGKIRETVAAARQITETLKENQIR